MYADLFYIFNAICTRSVIALLSVLKDITTFQKGKTHTDLHEFEIALKMLLNAYMLVVQIISFKLNLTIIV